MLLEKYRPDKIEDMANKTPAIEARNNIIAGKRFIITGPIGSGKTLSLKLIAKELRYEIIQVTDDMLKDSKESMGQKSIFYKGKLFLIDLDEIKSMEKMDKFIESSRHPVVMISDDVYQKRYYEIRKKHPLIKFRKIPDFYMSQTIKNICTKEEILCNDLALKKLMNLYNGDIRSVLIALDCLRSEGLTPESVKDLEECKAMDVFELLTEIFNGSINDSRKLMRKTDQDIFPWLEENVVDGASLKANEMLAKADLYQSRVRRSGSWSMEKYYFNFISGISTLKTGKKIFNPPFSRRKFRPAKKVLKN